jgi:hypothetical protein
MDFSELRDFALRASSDIVKTDLELICERCGSHLCDAQHGDSLENLAGVALDHRRDASCRT